MRGGGFPGRRDFVISGEVVGFSFAQATVYGAEFGLGWLVGGHEFAFDFGGDTQELVHGFLGPGCGARQQGWLGVRHGVEFRRGVGRCPRYWREAGAWPFCERAGARGPVQGRCAPREDAVGCGCCRGGARAGRLGGW